MPERVFMLDKLMHSLTLINESYRFRKKASIQDPYLPSIDPTINISLKSDPDSLPPKSVLTITYWQDPIEIVTDEFVSSSTIKETLIKYFRYFPCPIIFDSTLIGSSATLVSVSKEESGFDSIEKKLALFQKEFNLSYPPEDPTVYFSLLYPYHIDAWFYFSSSFTQEDSIRVFNNGIYQKDSDLVPEFLTIINQTKSYIQGVISAWDIELNSFIQKSVQNFITKKLADTLITTMNSLGSSQKQALFWLKVSDFIKQATLLDVDFFTKIKEILFIELQKPLASSKLLVSVDNFLKNIAQDPSCYKDFTLSKNSSIDSSYYSFLIENTGSSQLDYLYQNSFGNRLPSYNT